MVKNKGSTVQDDAESTYAAAASNSQSIAQSGCCNTGDSRRAAEALEEADQSPTSDGGRSSCCNSASHW